MGGLVDYLSSIKEDSSFDARKKLALKYGIENYAGTAEQNTLLLKKLQSKSNGIGIKVSDKKFDPSKKYIGLNPLIEKVKLNKSENKVSPPSVAPSKNGISGGVANPLSNMDNLLNKAGDSMASKLKSKDDLNKGIVKGNAIGQYAIDAMKGVNGIVQFIKGKKTLKGLDKPKYPEYLNNQLLSTRIAEAQQQAQMADPLIRSKGMSDLVNQRYLMDNLGKAVSGGDISSYGAFAQANADNQNKSIKDIMLSEVQDKLQKQQILDILINQGQSERQFAFNSQVNKFNQLDYPEFQAKKQYGENLVNTGISNIYGSAESMANNSPLLSYMKALNMKKTIIDREREKRQGVRSGASGVYQYDRASQF